MKRKYESNPVSTNEKQGTKVSRGNEEEKEIFYNPRKVS
jgi:hypothetical protein